MGFYAADERQPALEAEFRGWTIIRRRFADGWNLSAFHSGNATTGRMPDLTRKTEDELRAAIRGDRQ